MSDFQNALESFGATQGSAQSYVASKRDKFFKDYKDRLTKTAQSQAEALGLSQEKQEKLSNTIETLGIQLPIVGAAVKKGYDVFKARGAASDGASSAGSTTASVSGATEGAEGAGEGAEGAGEGAEAAGEGAEAAGGAAAEGGGGAAAAAGGAAEEGVGAAASAGGITEEALGGSVIPEGGALPSILGGGGMATSGPGGAAGITTSAGEGAEAAGEGAEAAGAGGAAEGAGGAAAAAGTAGAEAGGIAEIGGVTATVEGATGGALSELVLPAAAIGVIGYSIYDLFSSHHSAPEETAPPSTFLTGHATGISDAITRGRFASAGLDSVTSLPAQNSAF